MLRHLVDEHRKALVIVTHDLELAAKADRRVTLIDGKIVADERIAQLAGVAG